MKIDELDKKNHMEKKKEKNYVDELFICTCNDTEHQIIMSYFKDTEFPYVYCSIHLVPERNILKRIRNAVRYIFGHRCAYGHFEEFIFRPEDADRLQSIVDYLKLMEEKNGNRTDNNEGMNMKNDESEIRREVENAAKAAAMFNDVSKEQMFKLGFQYAIKMLKEAQRTNCRY